MLDDLDLAVQASQIRVGGTLDTCWLESDVWIEAWAVLGQLAMFKTSGRHTCLQCGSSLACSYPDMAVGLTGGGPRHACSNPSVLLPCNLYILAMSCTRLRDARVLSLIVCKPLALFPCIVN